MPTSTFEMFEEHHNISDSLFPPLDADARFWWHTTARILASMLNHADYDLDAAIKHLLLYRSLVVPYLGRRPTSADVRSQLWRSYVTDDHSPIEYSWSWPGIEERKPKVRLTIEPVGLHSGSPKDPYNQYMADNFLRNAQRCTAGADLTLYDHFRVALLSTAADTTLVDARAEAESHRSSVFVAIEFGDNCHVFKVYFMPMVKALEMDCSRAQVLFESIRSLNQDHLDIRFSAFDSLAEFMNDDDLGSRTEVEMVAVDCLEPSTARLKVYLRSQETSWQSICHNLTMNGHIAISQPILENLRKLWYSVLNLEVDFPATKQLPQCDRAEAGTFYCFYARPGDDSLRSKLYIPAKYYGHNDAAIAEGLSRYLSTQGQGDSCSGYGQVLEDICSHRCLTDGCGIHSYISCEPKDDTISITSYLCPEIYHPARRRC